MKVARLNVTTSSSHFLFLALRVRERLTSPVLSLLTDKSVHKLKVRIVLIFENIVKC